MSPDLERLWGQLLQFVEEGRVVPVVGRDLLQIEDGTRRRSLDEALGERLAARLGVEAAAPTVNAVACHHVRGGGELEDVYSAMALVLAELQPAPPPSLRKLAEILPLKLFVTTTSDSLLASALDLQRFAGRRTTEVLAYSPEAPTDIPAEAAVAARPIVYHIFGKASAVPDYVVTDEDLLEFVVALQSGNRRPARLFDVLRRSQLLIIGTGFSDWLARLFLRLARGERLSSVRGRTDVLADLSARDDPGLVVFLRQFSTRTKVFPGSPEEFVEELHARWRARHGASEPAPASGLEPAAMDAGAVFLSYASEDLAAAQAIHDALEQAGIAVWFDKRALEAGDVYESKIRRNIEESSLFIPVVSRNTLTSRRRFFRLEWDHASRVAVQAPPNVRFILPLVIDETSPSEAAIPDAFRHLHWTRLPGAAPTPEFVEEVRRLYRAYHASLAS